MKLFSNFDTTFDEKIYNDNVKKYGINDVMIIYRDRIFLLFFVILPIIIYILLLLFILGIGFSFDLGETEFNVVKWGILGIFIFFSFLIFGWKILKRYIDYKMDFCVVTPNEVIAYNQSGFFGRTARTISSQKIKTISVDKEGLIASIFNLGTLKFLSEGDNSGSGDITLFHVYSPDSLKDSIKDILNIKTPQNQDAESNND